MRFETRWLCHWDFCHNLVKSIGGTFVRCFLVIWDSVCSNCDGIGPLWLNKTSKMKIRHMTQDLEAIIRKQWSEVSFAFFKLFYITFLIQIMCQTIVLRSLSYILNASSCFNKIEMHKTAMKWYAFIRHCLTFDSKSNAYRVRLDWLVFPIYGILSHVKHKSPEEVTKVKLVTIYIPHSYFTNHFCDFLSELRFIVKSKSQKSPVIDSISCGSVIIKVFAFNLKATTTLLVPC